jgi:hypothetical protein
MITYAHDVETVAIDIPMPLPGDTTIYPEARVVNCGDSTETFDVTCEINPGAYSSTTTVFDLAWNHVDSITFPDSFTFVSGYYTVTVYTQLIGDENPTNDTMEIQVETDWLYYDDGIPYDRWAWYYAGNGWGVQFPVSVDWWVDSIAAHIWDESWPSPGGNTATFWLYDGATEPTNRRWEMTNTTIVRGNWNKFPVDTTLTFYTAGDNTFFFYIQVEDYPNCPALTIDDRPDAPAGMHWYYYEGMFAQPIVPGDRMLRVHVIPSVGIGEWISITPDAFSLRVPAICRGKAEVEFVLSQATKVELLVYDIMGRRCETLVSNRFSAGTHYQSFNLDLASGVYFFNLRTESGINITRKFLFLR